MDNHQKRMEGKQENKDETSKYAAVLVFCTSKGEIILNFISNAVEKSFSNENLGFRPKKQLTL